ncbi:hypothetical protein Tco_0985649, partial [Tanacetum coccineum]
MARKCTQPKRPRNAAWYKEKAMLAEAREARKILDEKQLAFLAGPGVPDGQAVQTIIPNTAAFQTEDVDTYDSDCDDLSNARAVHMANISNYGSDIAQQDSMILSVIEQMCKQMINHVNNWEKANKEQNNESVTVELERYKERVKTFEERLNIDLSSHEKMIYSQMDDMIKEKLVLKEQVDSLEQKFSNKIKEKEMAQPENNNTLSSAFKTFFEREKLSGDNFNDWYRSLRIVLRVAGTYDYLYKPCPDEPPENAAENVKAAWKAEYKIHSDVACLMLGKMSPALQRFEKPQAVEIYDLVDTLHSCKQASGKSVSAHVLEMKGYMDQL